MSNRILFITLYVNEYACVFQTFRAHFFRSLSCCRGSLKNMSILCDLRDRQLSEHGPVKRTIECYFRAHILVGQYFAILCPSEAFQIHSRYVNRICTTYRWSSFWFFAAAFRFTLWHKRKFQCYCYWDSVPYSKHRMCAFYLIYEFWWRSFRPNGLYFALHEWQCAYT